jgi:hypothetical protein
MTEREQLHGAYTDEDLRAAPPPPDLTEDDAVVLEDLAYLELLSSNLSAATAIGERMVVIAESQRGVRESGGANRGEPYERYVKPFGAAPSAWCAFFVSWCYWQTTGRRPPWSAPGWVASVQEWGRANGKLVTNPARGDAFGVGGEHMGLVTARLRDGHVLTIEGNYGDAVTANKRPIRGLWYARMG